MPFFAILAAIGALAKTAVGVVGGILAGGGIGAALLKAGLAFGINALASAIFKPKQESQTGLEVSLQTGGDVPRSVQFGEGPNRGHLVYQNSYGNDNLFLQLVFVLSECECEGLSGIVVNGESLTLNSLSTVDGEDARYSVAGYETDDSMIVRFYSGKTGQIADQELIDNANPSGRWTSASKLTGMSYVYVRLRWSDDLFGETGIPELKFILKGAKLYDPRLDSTNGGSGSHRWSDKTTWAYSGNPALFDYNGARGMEVNGQRVFGLRMIASDFDNTTLFAALDDCDQDVSLDGGGTEKRYRAFVIGRDDEEFSVFHRKCLNAMSGFTVPRSGKLGYFAGVEQSVSDTVTDDDLVIERDLEFDNKLTRSLLVNRVHGQFRDPSQLWELNDYPAIVSTAAATEDGEEIGQPWDLTMVTSATQAQRCAKIRLLEVRQQARAVATFGFNKQKWDAGDWITWNSTRFPSKTWRVAERLINEDRTVTVILDEIQSAVYDWSTSEEGIVASPPTAGAKGTQTSTAVIQFVNQAANDGTVLEIIYNPISDPTVVAVKFELREINTDTVTRFSDPSPDDGVYHYYNADPAKRYEVRATVVTDPPRSVTWSAWKASAATEQPFVYNLVRNHHFVSPGALATVSSAADIAHFYCDGDLSGIEVLERFNVGVPGTPPVGASHVLKLTLNGVSEPVVFTEYDPDLGSALGLGPTVEVGQEVTTTFDAAVASGTATINVRLLVKPKAGGAAVPQVNKRTLSTFAAIIVGTDWEPPVKNFSGAQWDIDTEGEAFIEFSRWSTSNSIIFLTNIQMYRRDAVKVLGERNIVDAFSESVATGANDIVGTGISNFHDAITASVTMTIPKGEVFVIEAECLFYQTFTAAGQFDARLEIDGTTFWSAGAADDEQPPPRIGTKELEGTGEEETYDVILKWSAENTVTIKQRVIKARVYRK